MASRVFISVVVVVVILLIVSRVAKGKNAREKAETMEKARENAQMIQRVDQTSAVKQMVRPIEQTVTISATKPINQVKIPDFQDPYGDLRLAYQYDHVDVCILKGQEIDFDTISIGEMVILVPEPTNTYDPKAVRIVAKNKVGYLYRGKIQDMVNDYDKKDFLVSAYIDSIDKATGKVTIKIGFYKPGEVVVEEKKAGKKHKKFRLTGNTNEDMQGDLVFCSVGDEVDYLYDYDKDKYSATCNGYDIGYFPKSANDLLEGEHEAILDSVEENDNGVNVVYVAVIEE